jgi:hypothetical protein
VGVVKRDLFSPMPAVWLEQDALARKVAQSRIKKEKDQIVTLLCASLARMTEKPRHRRPL